MRTSEVLNKAADLIERRGWRTGGGWPERNKDGAPLCLEGGVLAAMGLGYYNEFDNATLDAFENCPAYSAVQAYVDHYRALYWWNDASGRTASEVIEVLRACALIEAAREEQNATWESYAWSADEVSA